MCRISPPTSISEPPALIYILLRFLLHILKGTSLLSCHEITREQLQRVSLSFSPWFNLSLNECMLYWPIWAQIKNQNPKIPRLSKGAEPNLNDYDRTHDVIAIVTNSYDTEAFRLPSNLSSFGLVTQPAPLSQVSCLPSLPRRSHPASK